MYLNERLRENDEKKEKGKTEKGKECVVACELTEREKEGKSI